MRLKFTAKVFDCLNYQILSGSKIAQLFNIKDFIGDFVGSVIIANKICNSFYNCFKGVNANDCYEYAGHLQVLHEINRRTKNPKTIIGINILNIFLKFVVG